MLNMDKFVVTFQTACRLKAAGFPQPELEKGQYWYDAQGKLFTLLFYASGPKFWGIFYWESEALKQELPTEMIFAAGYADITGNDIESIAEATMS